MLTLALIPPTTVISLLCFVGGVVLHALDRPKWGNVAVAAGLAMMVWPW